MSVCKVLCMCGWVYFVVDVWVGFCVYFVVDVLVCVWGWVFVNWGLYFLCASSYLFVFYWTHIWGYNLFNCQISFSLPGAFIRVCVRVRVCVCVCVCACVCVCLCVRVLRCHADLLIQNNKKKWFNWPLCNLHYKNWSFAAHLKPSSSLFSVKPFSKKAITCFK